MNIRERWDSLTDLDRKAITILHSVLSVIKNNPSDFADPVQFIEDIEFTLQGLWKFDRDERYHTHWKDIKGCNCPKMDNDDPFFYGGGKIIVSDCKWHGNLFEEEISNG